MASTLVPNHNRRFGLLDRESCSLGLQHIHLQDLTKCYPLKAKGRASVNFRVVG